MRAAAEAVRATVQAAAAIAACLFVRKLPYPVRTSVLHCAAIIYTLRVYRDTLTMYLNHKK